MRSEEVLGEILGHSNFDGEDWAVGDSIVFEDGTGATIQKEEQFHVWSDPRPIELPEALALIQKYGDPRLSAGHEIGSFSTLFAVLSVPPSKRSWWQAVFAR